MVSVVIEGPGDRAAIERIVTDSGCFVHLVYGQTGKAFIDQHIAGYNNAARFQPWLVVRDLDNEPCALELARRILPNPALWMRFRIAVRETEAWLLADADAMSAFLRVRRARVPADPDTLPDPKQALVNLARRSTSRAIRDDIVPEEGVAAAVGPGYVSRINEFARHHWRPDVARRFSPSLDSCLSRATELAAFGV